MPVAHFPQPCFPSLGPVLAAGKSEGAEKASVLGARRVVGGDPKETRVEKEGGMDCKRSARFVGFHTYSISCGKGGIPEP